jgi:hypothetical protein
VNTDELIAEAIARGLREGAGALDAASAVAFWISEAEVYCDKDGVDALIWRYGTDGLAAAARAFAEVGATLIAQALIQLAADPSSERRLETVNGLITKRAGYDYEMIASAMQRLRAT